MFVERIKYGMQRRWVRASRRLKSLVIGSGLADPLTPYEAEAVNDLETEGVHVTTADRLFSESAHKSVTNAAALVKGGISAEAALWRKGSSSTDLFPEALLQRTPEIYLLGLDPPLLRLAQHYLRLQVAYHGAVLRHSLVDGGTDGTRLWHQDGEDLHVLRVVVYLNDVTLGGGPFEYITRSPSMNYKRFSDVAGRPTNDRMLKIVPLEKWKRCFGPAGTVVLADTANVFHHESLQTERDRFVVMMGYSSRRPTGMSLAMEHFPVERLKPELRRIVPAIYYDHVFEWRRQAREPLE